MARKSMQRKMTWHSSKRERPILITISDECLVFLISTETEGIDEIQIITGLSAVAPWTNMSAHCFPDPCGPEINLGNLNVNM